MKDTKPLSPDDVSMFYRGKLAEDRLELLMQALEAEDPKVLCWMELLDCEEHDDLEPVDAATSSLREQIGSRMQSLRRAALWAFSSNPFAALLAGEPAVRLELFGKIAGQAQMLDAMMECVAGSERDFLLRISDLPESFEPLHLALAEFNLRAEIGRAHV